MALRLLKPRIAALSQRAAPVAAVERIRGRQLQRIREEHFRAHPLCVKCEGHGIIRIAVELDHIVPLALGGPDASSNRQGLCYGCHEVKTEEDMKMIRGAA